MPQAGHEEQLPCVPQRLADLDRQHGLRHEIGNEDLARRSRSSRRRSCGARSVHGGGTTTTGTFALWRTPLLMDPRSAPIAGLCPCVPTTMRAASLAASRMAPDGRSPDESLLDLDIRVVAAEAGQDLGGQADLVVGNVGQRDRHRPVRDDEQVVGRDVPRVHGDDAPAVEAGVLEGERQRGLGPARTVDADDDALGVVVGRVRTTATGHSACAATCALTDPSSRPAKPPRPRDPITTSSAVSEASRRTPLGAPTRTWVRRRTRRSRSPRNGAARPPAAPVRR